MRAQCILSSMRGHHLTSSPWRVGATLHPPFFKRARPCNLFEDARRRVMVGLGSKRPGHGSPGEALLATSSFAKRCPLETSRERARAILHPKPCKKGLARAAWRGRDLASYPSHVGVTLPSSLTMSRATPRARTPQRSKSRPSTPPGQTLLRLCSRAPLSPPRDHRSRPR